MPIYSAPTDNRANQSSHYNPLEKVADDYAENLAHQNDGIAWRQGGDCQPEVGSWADTGRGGIADSGILGSFGLAEYVRGAEDRLFKTAKEVDDSLVEERMSCGC